MFVLSAHQIREWDRYTIQHEPISSIDLMERAAAAFVNRILQHYNQVHRFVVFCGPGNNGGDGLAIGRLLSQTGNAVVIYILSAEKYSTDHQLNLARLQQAGVHEIHFLHSEKDLPVVTENEILIDALFGTGLKLPLQGFTAAVVHHMNRSNSSVISVDLPSGLFADESSVGNPVVQAGHTLSFQCYKKALLMQENARAVGTVEVLDIGLHQSYLSGIENKSQVISESFCKSIFKKRNRFAHKGIFGHALLVAGSYGKIGAAILAARACLHSGTGLLTSYLPRCGYEIMQVAVPEAMVLTDTHEHHLSELPNEIERYSAIGIGPGIGTAEETQRLVSFLVR